MHKILMAKWDIKDGFWRMDCEHGEEWNFACILPQEEGKPIQLVVPTLLQMGCVEFPPCFCAAAETTLDVATEYIETPVNLLRPHTFHKYVVGDVEYETLPKSHNGDNGFLYMVEVYIHEIMSLVIPVSWEQLWHAVVAIMIGVHDVFPLDADDSNDPISEKKLRAQEGLYSTRKTLLGFDFDGKAKTIWLEAAKRKTLLTILKGWIWMGWQGMAGIHFAEFKSTVAKLCHSFRCIPVGVGLLSLCNSFLKAWPDFVYLHKNHWVLNAPEGCCTLLHESTREPTRCRELTGGWSDFVRIIDASGQGAGGVVIGKLSACTPTVFQWQWPDDIKTNIASYNNPMGEITNSNLKMAGLAVPSRHYVGRMGCHIYNWSARRCRTYIEYTRKIKHQTGIFQIITLVHLQGTVHWSMYKLDDNCALVC
jgi:hypothetical protein